MTASGGAGHSHRPAWRMPACSTPRALSSQISCAASLVPRRSSGRISPENHSRAHQEAARPYALETLADDETVAQLATGIKRFKLPDEFNPIKIYQAIAGDPGTGHGEEALNILASIFVKRGQLDRAADYLKRSLEVYGEKDDRWKTKQLNQILGSWGEFAAAQTATRRPRSLRRLPVPQQPPGPFRGTRNPFRQAREGCQGLLLTGTKATGSRAEVTDQSRRTIVGTGTVLVARRAVPRLYLGRSRPLPRRRHDRGGDHAPDARPQAGCRQGNAQAAEDHLRRRAAAGRDARRELGPGTRRRRAGPPGDQGVEPPASTAWRRRSTTARAM